MTGGKQSFLTFCTLMLWLVLLKIRLALIAFAKRRAFKTLAPQFYDNFVR